MRARLAIPALAALIPTLALSAAPPAEDARGVAAALDYVAGDYGEAVADGVVVDADEYEEQLEHLEDARRLAARLTPPDPALEARLTALDAEVRALAAVDAFAADARAVRREVVERYAVRVAPDASPDRARGAALYAERCASCHGADGGADTAAAKRLDPAPRDFLDAEDMERLTPSRAWQAISHGVEGTAMAAFPDLSDAERWDLAFTVVALRFDEAEAARGARLLPSAPALADLADRTDAELLASIPEPDRGAAAAWLRRTAAFAAGHQGS